MANEAIGMIETKGLVALVQATDAMLKAASVKFVGWNKVGSGLCSVYVTGDVGSRARRGGCGRQRGARGRRSAERACDCASARHAGHRTAEVDSRRTAAVRMLAAAAATR